MEKYFKKIYSDRIAYGKWTDGDGINYSTSSNGSYTVELITKAQYTSGVKIAIPKTKGQIIEEKKTELATDALKADGILDSNGDLVG